MKNAAGIPQGTVKWKPVRLGGVGFVTGFGISDDAVTQVCRIDVFNCYVKSTAVGDKVWRPAFTSASLAIGDCPGTAGYVAPTSGLVDFQGGYEIVVAPNSNSTLYAVWNARVWKSTNTGQTWVHQTGVPDVKAEANNGPQPHNHGPNMAVDPQNAGVVLLGTQANGLYYTTNGGTTWTNVALGTNGTNRGWQVPSKVACDGSSSVVSSIKQRWAAVLQGTGISISTTGPGGTYSATTGGPAWVGDLVFDSLGNLWATDVSNSTTNNLWKMAAGGTTWVNAPGSAPYLPDQSVTICCDPLLSGHIAVFNDTGEGYTTANSGTSWTSITNLNLYAYTLPWLGGGHTTSLTMGMARFDPVTANKLWTSSGIGTYSTSCPTGATSLNWTECTEGIECADANNMVEPLGGSPIFAIWDQGAWRMDNPDLSWRGYANRTPAGAFASSVQACWDVDCASDDPTYIAALIDFSGQWSAYSTNGWSSCQVFPTSPPFDLLGGSVTCGPKNNILVNQTGGDNGSWASPYYTKDGGTTWATVNVPGVTTSFTGKIDNGSGSAGTTLTVTAMIFGTIVTGLCVNDGAGNSGQITGQTSGTTGGAGVYTLGTLKNFNGGVSTLLVTSRTLSATAGGFGASADYVHRKSAAYDALAGKYYMINYGTQDGLVNFTANAGVWSTSDLASAWTKTYAGNIWSYNADFWAVRLKWVPGQQGHFFICGSNGSALGLMRTTNGFTTAPTSVANVTDVSDIVFGPAAPGQSYPSIYFVGKLSGVFGIYRSDDNFASTPKLLTVFPGNCIDSVVVLGASPNKYGRIYAGLQGSGWMYADYDCPLTAS